MIKDRKFELGIGIGMLLGIALTKASPYVIPQAIKGYRKTKKLLKDYKFMPKIGVSKVQFQEFSKLINESNKSSEHQTQYFEVPIVVTEDFHEEQ